MALNVQNAMPTYPTSSPTAKSFPVTSGPTDRARQENEADAPLTLARNSLRGVVADILVICYVSEPRRILLWTYKTAEHI